MVDLIGSVAGVIVLLLMLALVGLCVSLVWSAVTGRRNEGMDEEYDSRPCPNCGHGLGEGHTECPECGRLVRVGEAASPYSSEFDVRRLRDDWPKANLKPIVPQPWDPLTEIYESRDGWLVDLLVEQLAARGVWARVNAKTNEEVVGAFAHTVTVHKIAVADVDRAEAEAVLDLFRIDENALLCPPERQSGADGTDAGGPPVLDYEHGQSPRPPQHRQG
ncbi:MAG TPA: zinc ribbon domain-containing protein [Humisphaera sp.]